jgi:hypothetical protein
LAGFWAEKADLGLKSGYWFGSAGMGWQEAQAGLVSDSFALSTPSGILNIDVANRGN